MKKYLVIGFLVLFGLFFRGLASADIAPPTPAYLNTYLNVKVGLGNLADDYVIIQHSQHFGEYFSQVTDLYVSPNGYGAETYFAMDKNYFESNGAIDGLFSVTGADESTTMSPKDSESFNAHIFNFVIAKNDPLLDSEFGRIFDKFGDEVVNDEYVKFPFKSDFYVREGQNDSNCETGFEGNKDCRLGEQTLIYLPQQVFYNNIVLVNSENLKEPDTQNQDSISTASQHIPWYKKLWDFIKSLF